MAITFGVLLLISGVACLFAFWSVAARRDQVWQSSVRALAEQVADVCYPAPANGGLNTALVRLVVSTARGLATPLSGRVVPSVLPSYQGLDLRPQHAATGRSDRSLAGEYWAALDALRPAGQPHATESAHELVSVSLFVAALTDPLEAAAIRAAARDFAGQFNTFESNKAVRFDAPPSDARPTDSSRWATFGTSESDVRTLVYRYPLVETVDAEVKVRAKGWCGPAPVPVTPVTFWGRGLVTAESIRSGLVPHTVPLWWIGMALVTAAVCLVAVAK
ncbi:hypothetical protein [Paludisphaera sp.]|uniref:hypothetical protein n=1 Tax=Paludisphaera sp. TaxID=2017432 RepID=UPI00301DA45F